jgi:hypothetical protein
MRRTVLLAIAALALAAAAAPALDIAVGGGYRYQVGVLVPTDFSGWLPQQVSTVGLDLRAWPYPLLLGIGFTRVANGPFGAPFTIFENFTLRADWWLLDRKLGKLPLNVHLGAGAWAGIPIVNFGLRGVAGLRWSPVPADPGFEVWLELEPAIGMYVAPGTSFVGGIAGGVGVRYWFGR